MTPELKAILQQHFNQVYTHFVTNGGLPSLLLAVEAKDAGTVPGCKYRKDLTPTCPERCGIGVLIPDAQYNRVMEGLSVGALVRMFPQLGLQAGLTDPYTDLQIIHDNEAIRARTFPEVFNERVRELLKNFATRWELTIPDAPTTPLA